MQTPTPTVDSILILIFVTNFLLVQYILILISLLVQYMDENLTDGGEGGRNGRPGVVRTTSSSAIPQIKRWIRTPKAIIMHLTNGTIQVGSISSHPEKEKGNYQNKDRDKDRT